MKHCIAPFFILFLCISLSGQQPDSEGFETFQYEDGDTTFTMKKYYFCLLKRGDKGSFTDEERAEMQEQHLAYISSLAEKDKIHLSGPFGDDGELRGILIFNTTTLEEADSLVHDDPFVRAGILEVEIHPWWGAKGTSLR